MDELTGLLDRKKCIEEAWRLTEQARQNGDSLCILWINLNRFREVNGSFGHHTGDELLVRLASRLQAHAGPSGPLGRMGADEFLVLLPGFSLKQAETLARQIHGVFCTPISIGQNISWRQSCSIGLALLGEESHLELLERADQAMQDARRKDLGLSIAASIAPGNSDMAHLQRRELFIEQQLHEALEKGGFSLLYQPIVNTVTQQVETCEALMRCQVQGQTIMPDQFIPVAEKTGLITQLGDWSLLTAARMAEQLTAMGRSTRIAVNISRAQLTAPKFQQTLQTLLAITTVSATQLELELTESLFMDSSQTVRRNLAAAVEAGFYLAIDDFGTGYSCLADLKDIPANKLKLDRSFITGLPHDRKSLAIIRAMTQLARDLGMTVVAEGVETIEQRDILMDAGVHVLQGFFYSRPLAEQHLPAWMTHFESSGT